MAHGILPVLFPRKNIGRDGETVIWDKFTEKYHASADLLVLLMRHIKPQIKLFESLVKGPGNPKNLNIQKQKAYDADQTFSLIQIQNGMAGQIRNQHFRIN